MEPELRRVVGLPAHGGSDPEQVRPRRARAIRDRQLVGPLGVSLAGLRAGPAPRDLYINPHRRIRPTRDRAPRVGALPHQLRPRGARRDTHRSMPGHRRHSQQQRQHHHHHTTTRRASARATMRSHATIPSQRSQSTPPCRTPLRDPRADASSKLTPRTPSREGKRQNCSNQISSLLRIAPSPPANSIPALRLRCRLRGPVRSGRSPAGEEPR